jgi:flagellar L-ring protein precursor FlgH
LKFSSKNDYKGTGNTLRNDRFEAKITCIVREILPNSNMVIQGQQNVTVNAEDQTIVLTGIVRPEM